MSTQANVVLRFLVSGQNSVSGVIDKLTLKKKELTKPATIPLEAEDNATVTIDKVRAEADALNKKRAEIPIGTNNAKFKADMIAIDMRLEKLNRYLAAPDVELDGLDQTLLGIYRISAAMDKLNGKTAHVRVNTTGSAANKNVVSRILGALGGGGSSGGAFSGPFKGVSGVGAGGSAAAIEALTSPVGAGSALAALPFLGTGIAGGALGALGAGLAGIGIAGGMGAGTSKPKDIAAAQNTLHAAQQRVIADQAKLNALQSSGKATSAQLASAQAALASANASVASAQDKINSLGPPASKQVLAAQAAFTKLSTQAKKSLATIGASFAPVMSTIFKVASGTLSKMTPVFAGAEKTISGPFKQVGVILATSLGSPAVVTAVKSLAKAFGEFLSGFAPQIPGIVNALANGITGMATAFTDHPGMIKGMGSVLAFLLKIPGFVAGALGSLTRVTAWLIGGLPHAVSIGLDAARGFFINIGHGIESAWDSVWNNVKGTTSAGAGVLGSFWTTITGPFRAGYNFVLSIFNGIKNFITTNFDKWWAANGEAVIAIWTGIWMKVKQVATTLWNGILFALKGFFAVIASIFMIGKTLILGIWGAIWPIVKAVFQAAWTLIQYAIRAGWVIIKTAFQVGAALITLVWKNTWAVLKFVVQQVWAAIRTVIKVGWDIIVGLFSAFINILTGRWGAAWKNIRNMFQQVWNAMRSFLQGSLTRMWNTIVSTWTNVFNFFRTVPGKILRAIGSLANLLVGVGRNVIGGLFNGIKQALANVGHWIKANLVDPIVNAVKHLFGIRSPSTVMHGIGGHLIGGLLRGILSSNPTKFIGKIFGGLPQALGAIVGKGLIALEHLPANALKALGKVGGAIGGFFSHLFGGGASGNPGAIAAMKMAAGAHGWGSGAQWEALNYVEMREAGYNIRAVNPSSGAYGMAQFINGPAEYAQYGGNANTAMGQAIGMTNYIAQRYGSPIAAAAHERAFNWYAKGTNSAVPGWAWVGERGPELVNFGGGEKVIPASRIRGGDGASVSHYTIEVSVPPSANPRETGRQIVEAIKKFEAGSGKGWRS